MAPADRPAERKPKPFIGVKFDCCNVYMRIRLNRVGTAFVGWCPRCTKRVEVKVAKSGSSNPFFIAN